MSAASRSMAERRDGLAWDFGPGPIANDNHTGPSASSALPPDAQAVIEPLPLATNQGGRGRHAQWRVRFAPRWRPVADPLTGWTGGGDPLDTIELRFADLEAAANYCRGEGLRFSTHGEPRCQHPFSARLPAAAVPALCCWPTGPHARCCGAYPIAAVERDCRPRFSLGG